MDNKLLVRRLVEEVFNQGRHDLVDEFYAPDLVAHDPAYPAELLGVGGLKQLLHMYRIAFPDQRYTIDDIFSDGDRVAFRWNVTGTDRGGLMGRAPTGKRVSATGISILQIVDNRVQKVWQQFDNLGFLKQLGLGPGLITV
jgi:steroid delta-isomerase-like uncharacterized protein